MKRITKYILILFLLGSFGAAPACASIIFSVSGTSAKDVPVSFEAQLTITAKNLVVILTNDSEKTLNPDDLLCSFYFDILNSDNIRPTLTYVSAIGDVYKTDKNHPDALIALNGSIKVTTTFGTTGGWQFKTMDPNLEPRVGFGIGTVGNNNLTPNNFNGKIVKTIDYGIYTGDVSTQNLHNYYLVRDTATFNFTGVSGYSETDIVNGVLFGLGSMPDSTLFAVAIPVPTTILLLASGLVGLGGIRRKLGK